MAPQARRHGADRRRSAWLVRTQGLARPPRLPHQRQRSLPNWALLVETGRFPARGDYVVFAPGHDLLVIKHFGADPKPFAKITYGVPGDVVTRTGDAVQVNGKTIAHLKPKTHQGEDLVPGPLGTIPPGCIYAGSPHKDGFDSRYAAIGFVCRDRLIGIGTPIL
ncbi:S26 family signal peptidase [Novosphingobium pokkalii]|uniref:S26 family signal peptidase n=1 Tax=Novosphingobium pokkalii TaxID=1770194 RepID=UPI00363553F7